MKIQNLAIIFLIIIIPISIVLSAYTQFQISTLNLQTLYDTKLTSATYDAIKAFQLNTANSTMSDLSNSRMRDIEASITTFKNSIMSTFGLNGYTEEELNSYIPALVYTMYDGFYIYSPYKNVNYLYTQDGQPVDNNGETMFGLKPYINYSCRYQRGVMDIVITYTLDNYITIQGTLSDGTYVNDSGYLVEGIKIDNSGKVSYNNIEITPETNLTENVAGTEYPYIKLNGTKYYYDNKGTADSSDDEIFYNSNGERAVQGEYRGAAALQYYNEVIKNNTSAIKYYVAAKEFTDRVKGYGLYNLTYEHARDVILQDDGSYEIQQLWPGDTRKIFTFTGDNSGAGNIENELSTFNQHRLAVIRNKIERNLSIAIANYNKYSEATDIIEFQMPELKETEWDLLMNNVSLMSFVQGLYIGGKIYNGYSVVNNSETKEVVQEENLYILGKSTSSGKFYYRIGDKYLETEANIETTVPAGRLNLDFKRNNIAVTSGTNTQTVYYYPLKDYNGSYSSIITQNNVTGYEDIYEYIANSNNTLKKAFYTALGRERWGSYKFSNNSITPTRILVVVATNNNANSAQSTANNIVNKLNQNASFYAESRTYSDSTNNAGQITTLLNNEKENYDLIIVNNLVWDYLPSNISEIAQYTNLITISNDACDTNKLPMIQEGITTQERTVTTSLTTEGSKLLGSVSLGTYTDNCALIRFKTDENIKILSKSNSGGAQYDGIGCWERTTLTGRKRWIHSSVSLENTNIINSLVNLALYGSN